MSTPEIILCPKCNNRMVVRNGKRGQFYGCSQYFATKCNGFRPYYEPKVIRQVQDTANVIGTDQQESIWNYVQSMTKNLIILARAGCGKTFTIVHMLQYFVTMRVIFIAFNKHIVRELSAKVPHGVAVSTIHGFALKQIKRWNPKVTIDDKGEKLRGIIDRYVPDSDENAEIRESITQLTDLAKYNMIDGSDRHALESLALHHNITIPDSSDYDITKIVTQVIADSKAMRNVIDFTDMIWFIFAHSITVETYDRVVADEIQDFNPLQQYIVTKMCGKSGLFIGVGDDRQSIYGFAGADIYSIKNMIAIMSDHGGIEVKPLTKTRRCPISHVEYAKMLVADFESMDGAINGTIERMYTDRAIEMINAGDMGLCRTNAPLVSIAYKLIRSGKSVIVKGRDIGKGLLALIRKLKAKTVIELIDKAEDYRIKEIEKLSKRGKKAENQIQAVNDKIATLIALTDGKYTINDVKQSIDSLFTDNDPSNSVVLSSIHKAKGLEAKNVYLFNYDRIELKLSLPWMLAQEQNCHYIAITRSKENLYLVNDQS